MALTSSTLPEAVNQSNNSTQTDEDLFCWRCGEPDSEHQWYGGRTYCDAAWPPADLPDVFFDDTKTFEPNPPSMTDEELVRRMAFIQDVRDWTL